MNGLTYRMTVQMDAEANPLTEDKTDDIVGFILNRCGAIALDYYPESISAAKIIFRCPEYPSRIMDLVVRPMISEIEHIYYVDVEFIYDAEFVPDRFVMYCDGAILKYTGRIEYTEDN